MKYCEEYAALLDPFVDGELPPEEMERVRAHLEICPGCRAYVDDALAIRAGFPDVEDTAVPEGFARGVMERIRRDAERERKAAKRKRVRRWAGTFSALAACCALVVLVRTGSGGLNRSGGAAVVTAGAGAEVPAAYDMNGGAVESGTAPQAAMAESRDTNEAAPEEETAWIEEQTVAGAASMNRKNAARDEAKEKDSPEYANLAAAAPAKTDEAADTAEAAEERSAALCLTAGEAGDLLRDYAVVREDAVTWSYELSGEEYQELLEALGRLEEMPEAAEGTFLVVVTGPSE